MERGFFLVSPNQKNIFNGLTIYYNFFSDYGSRYFDAVTSWCEPPYAYDAIMLGRFRSAIYSAIGTVEVEPGTPVVAGGGGESQISDRSGRVGKVTL